MLSTENTNPGLRNSLSCLAHPSVILSIFLLLLNDHLLKDLYPGVITGKLSDFAGLLFFPFTISLLVSIVVVWKGESQRSLGVLSIGFTAVVFIAIKTIPWANTAFEGLVTAATGIPSQIILDPTDLIALPILGYSWMLWNKQRKSVSTRRAWLMFGIAWLAAMATSFAPDTVVTQLVVQDNLIFAGTTYSTYVSDDEGLSWTELADVPLKVAESLENPPQLPKVVCDPYIETKCYRVSGDEVVERSTDGGSSWSVAWRVPLGRRSFMQRLVDSPLGRGEFDLGPYDIAIVGDAEQRSILAAMGTEGVLIGSEDDTWLRQEVGSAYPTRFAAEFNTEIIWILRWEIIAVSVTAILAWLILNNSYWKCVSQSVSKALPPERTTKWIYKPLRTFLGIYLLLFILGLWIALNIYQPGIIQVATYLLIGIQILPIAGYGIFVGRLKKYSPNPANVTKVILLLFSILAGLLVLGILPLVLWTLGVIPFYLLAFVLSVGIIVWLFRFASREIDKLASAAFTDPGTQKGRHISD